MSQQSIADKAQVIRTETQKYGNTRGRVADALDDINETKANNEDLSSLASSMQAADSALSQDIQNEAAARANADSALSQDIQNEATARANADNQLSSAIQNEATTRANADSSLNSAIQTEATTRANADSSLNSAIQAEATARANADNLKLDKPLPPYNTNGYVVMGDGSTKPAGDLGKNIYNTDGDLTANRNANLAAFYLNFYNSTNTAKIGINKANPTEALDVVGRIKADGIILNTNTSSVIPNRLRTDGTSVYFSSSSSVERKLMYADMTALTSVMTNASDTEKDAWRLAQRKTGENYSTGMPQVDAILPPVINGNETFNQFVTVVGLNLFVNNSSPSIAILEIRRVKDINGIILSTPDIFTGLNIEVSQNNPTILSTSINFSNMPKGYYKAFVTHNGLTNLTSPEFFVGDAITPIPLPLPFWTEQINGSPTAISNTQIISLSASPTTYKSAVITNSTLLQNGFIAEYVCEFSGNGTGSGSTGMGTFGIIGKDNVIYGIRISSIFNGARSSTFMPDNSVMNSSGSIGLSNKMYIIYKNDIVTVINQSTGKIKSFVDPSFKTTDKKAYYSMSGIAGAYSNSGSMTFNNIKSF